MPASKELRLQIISQIAEANKPLVKTDSSSEDFGLNIRDQIFEALMEETGYADEGDVEQMTSEVIAQLSTHTQTLAASEFQQELDKHEAWALNDLKEEILLTFTQSDERLTEEQLRKKVRLLTREYLEDAGFLISIDEEELVDKISEQVLTELQEAV